MFFCNLQSKICPPALPRKAWRAGNPTSRQAFTLLETLVYVAVLVVTTALVTTTVVGMLRPAARLRAARAINTSALSSLERMSREIRNAATIDTLGSVFGTHPGRLALTAFDGETPLTRTFYLEGTMLQVDNGSAVGALIGPDVLVSSLVFYRLLSGTSEGVRIEMELSTTTSSGTRRETFYTTVMLRDSYD